MVLSINRAANVIVLHCEQMVMKHELILDCYFSVLTVGYTSVNVL